MKNEYFFNLDRDNKDKDKKVRTCVSITRLIQDLNFKLVLSKRTIECVLR